MFLARPEGGSFMLYTATTDTAVQKLNLKPIKKGEHHE